jgi:hypothetical protein
MNALVSQLLNSTEPVVRYYLLTGVLDLPASDPQVKQAQAEVQTSPRARTMIAAALSTDPESLHPYSKWNGPHWMLGSLAEMGYPAGDDNLRPLLERAMEWLLPGGVPRERPVLDGRWRGCACQEGLAIYYMVKLGWMDARTEQLARHLIDRQWPDGGWNCDKHPDASNSSFMETLIPLRSMASFARASGSPAAQQAAARAAEVFLSRQLFRRKRDGRVMDENFRRLHYPIYWHYDILAGLTILNEAGCLRRTECRPALDLLLSKQLPSGGFAAEARYWNHTTRDVSGRSAVDWGPVGTTKMNEFVTAQALSVLHQASRLHPGLPDPTV